MAVAGQQEAQALPQPAQRLPALKRAQSFRLQTEQAQLTVHRFRRAQALDHYRRVLAQNQTHEYRDQERKQQEMLEVRQQSSALFP